MPTEHLAAYVAALRASAGVGTAETSYYPALSALMGAVGQALKPKVHCVVHPASRGSGLPDGALFEQRGKRDPLPSALDGSRTPERGVIEAKPFDHDLEALAVSEQVGRYLTGYGQVLLTNFHGFQLVRRGERGERVRSEHYALAPTGAELLRLRPAELAQREQPLLEYLTRLLLTPVGLSEAQAEAALSARSCLDVYLKETTFWSGVPETASGAAPAGPRAVKRTIKRKA